MKNIRCVEMDCNEFIAHVLDLIEKNCNKDFDIEFYSTYNESTEEYEEAYKLRKTSFIDSRILLCNSYGGGGYVSCEYDPAVCDEPEALIKETLEDYWFRMVFDTVYVELTEENQSLCHDGPVKTFVTTVEIERALFDRINSLLEIEDLNILDFCLDDFVDNNGEHGFTEEELAEIEEDKRMAEFLGAKRDDCISLFDIKFDNGYSITIDVCSGNESYYNNSVLYDENGTEITAYLTVLTLDRQMKFDFNDVAYVVELNVIETAV